MRKPRSFDMDERPRLELYAGLAALYQSREFSDLVVSGREGTRHPIHRAIVCPRSEHFYNAVKEAQWKDDIEGHISLPEDDEVVRLLVEYLYLLDYDPVVPWPGAEPSSHGNSSDSMSVSTEAGQYGHVFGTSAISAFGGPAQESPFSGSFRPRNDSSLTIHALPSGGTDFHHNYANQSPPRRRKTTRGMVMSAPDPSPLATKEPHLILHARMYAAGHQYGIDGLKALSLDKFKIQSTRHWNSPELAEAIHVVYTATPPNDKDMREAVADTLGWHSRLLDKPEIEVAIMEINGLAYELLKRSRRAEPEYMD
ncbi:hypothetical protein CLAFUW4_05488 [Fulvia fulva]|uniref:BTB domain-containing protein n=1 Tax=Passalora fulva TaxID=5499 RepID=A0A9Q8LJ14_PASFU|nr:uncharacterized protein CLAFUR5_05631 [Fulvia fulva]KAK4624351.1 hypothetical protein CLAFUR4_05482 [Fulvia fulva]KAK4624838.1 hypothetical protein CLAFUR0_05490 [Fulvia fulva]UJO18288.1 hypothetical protein CLAFUR5_05631 [Fulvia fulva]WPV14505.1 hypothetical protein CLAFUW4_05488 [Fulvia fulva]WPV29981.1 hypothetical protein CLAFUW7_05486 [Fulvia fulva]